MKTCKKCHIEQPLTDFPRHSNCKGGHSSICKYCTAERNVYGRQFVGRGTAAAAASRRQNLVVKHGLAVVEAMESQGTDYDALCS